MTAPCATYERAVMLQMAVLTAAFENGGSIAFADLGNQVRATRRDLWRAIDAQCFLGNIKRHKTGGLVELTRSAMVAFAAGAFVRSASNPGVSTPRPPAPVVPGAVLPDAPGATFYSYRDGGV